jgi:hypothetical protein
VLRYAEALGTGRIQGSGPYPQNIAMAGSTTRPEWRVTLPNDYDSKDEAARDESYSKPGLSPPEGRAPSGRGMQKDAGPHDFDLIAKHRKPASIGRSVVNIELPHFLHRFDLKNLFNSSPCNCFGPE